MYYVYILKSKRDQSIYIGYTSDLKKRLFEHNDGKSRYTKHKTPLELIYYEAYKSKLDARYREQMLKKFAAGYKELRKRIRNSLDDAELGP